MRNNKIFSLILGSALLVSSCSLLEPENDNHSTFDRVYREPSFAEGLLMRAYSAIPTNDYTWDEVATDDAVTNDKFSSYMRIATGEWSALYNPQSNWNNCNRSISYINQFLGIVDNIAWKPAVPEQNALFIRRLKGESYGMRGLMKYYLLRNQAGIGASGELLGIPDYNKFLESDADYRIPRSKFAESVASANADFDEALKLLPLDYGNLAAIANLPAAYTGVTDINNYNIVNGDFSRQRMSGRIVKAMKARLALLAASPAFNPNNDVTLWETAANLTADLLKDLNGPSGLYNKGHLFYLKTQVDDAILTSGDFKDLPEILWRRPFYDDRTRESNNFPPSLYGDGRINPTQNLVDAFPMANGYPINDPKSLYDPKNPYNNRDPRLKEYIIYNGTTYKGVTIKTEDGSGIDAVDALTTSTRTGYYLRKMLREETSVNPAAANNQRHFNTHIRYTELYLNYAEAANEAWGPDGKGPNAFSSKEVIAAIRKRALITQPDNYLVSVTDKTQFRSLVRNERRLELCFEGFRFWDLRRWKEDLTVPATGVKINAGNYTYFTVEKRAYNNSYMHYGPIPDKEIVKFNIVQNKGWN